jgi:broad specificity phosphatase PhoE
MLYLVRHGQTDWNLEPARCQGWIVSSHLARARETAETSLEELVAGAEAEASSAAAPDEPGRRAEPGI